MLREKRYRVFVLLGAYGALLGTFLSGCTSNIPVSEWKRLDPPVGAPDFTLPRLDDGPVTLSQYRGHIVLVEFWATWCGPCRYSLPSLETISRQYRQQGVVVLLVNEGDSAKQVRAWAGNRFTAPMLLDEKLEVAERYHVHAIPRLFVLDGSGKILYDHNGYAGGLERALTPLLHQLLAESSRSR